MLDNCEHLIGACSKVADAILRHCPEIRVLATSREPLGIAGETIYRVPRCLCPTRMTTLARWTLTAPTRSPCSLSGRRHRA